MGYHCESTVVEWCFALASMVLNEKVVEWRRRADHFSMSGVNTEIDTVGSAAAQLVFSPFACSLFTRGDEEIHLHCGHKGSPVIY